MNKLAIYIIFLLLIFIYKKRVECFKDVFIPLNERILNSNENVSINLNLNKLGLAIQNMNEMIECIECNLKAKNCQKDQ